MKQQLGKNDVWQLNEMIKRSFRMAYPVQPRERVELVDNQIYLIDNRPAWVKFEGRLIPALNYLLESNFLKKVVVDMGAIQYVTSGADVFRPGIKSIDESIVKDEIIAIVDERHDKPLAVGIAMMSGPDMKAVEKGKVIKIVHYVGDRIWDFTKTI
ncbi:MAG: PUA domain-containing protein [Nanoarchaeota archaeon]